jgi:aromatic ring-cleaving dioxygenase
MAEIARYHAHIRFAAGAARESAIVLGGAVAARFPLRLGTVWDKPVGPLTVCRY